MQTCERLQQVHAYHDGELSASERSSVEAHLCECPACAAELAWLKGTSESLRETAAMEPAPMAMIGAIRARVAAEPDRRALRLAWQLTAAAAAIVLMCLGQLWVSRSERSSGGTTTTASASTLPTWEVWLAVDSDARATVSPDQALARWMAEDLSGNERGKQVQQP